MVGMKKKIAFILLAFIMLGTIAYFYVNRILLPGQVKSSLEARISEITHRSAVIEKIRFRMTKGISLENILLKETDTGQTFLQIDEIRFNILIIPFLREKSVIIPRIIIKKPVTQLIQHADGSFNFSNILEKKDTAPSVGQTKIFITQIKIIEGKVDYLKKSEQDFSVNFRDINLVASLSANKQLTYQISTTIPLEQSYVSAKGQYLVGSQDINLQLSLENINLMKYLRQFYPAEKIRLGDGTLSNADLHVQSGDGKLKISGNAYLTKADIRFNAQQKLTGNIRLLNTTLILDPQNITASGELRIPLAKFDITPQDSFEGDIQAQLHSITFDRKDNRFHLTGDIKADNMEVNLNDRFKLGGNLTTRASVLTFNDQILTLSGEYDVTNTLLSAAGKELYTGNFFTKNFSLKNDHGRLTLQSAVNGTNNYLTIGENKLISQHIETSDFSLEHADQTMHVKSQIKFEDAVISLKQGSKFQGTTELGIQHTYDFKNSKNSRLTGTLTLENGLLVGLPYIDTASNITGQISIADDRVNTESITFNAENTNFTLSGKVDGFENTSLDLDLSTESIELSRIIKFFPKFFEKHKINLDGRSAVKISFNGHPDQLENIAVAAYLKECTVTMEKLNEPIKNINGSLNYSKDNLKWSELSGTYLDFPFTLTGGLAGFSKPVINTSVRSPNLELKTEIQLYNNTIRFPVVEAKYFQSDFTGSADIYLFENADPDIQVTGRGVVSFENLANFIPAHKEKINSLELGGNVDTNIFFKGKLAQWEDWSLTLDGRTSTLTLKKHPLKDVKITYLQRDKNISKLNLSADLYDGKLDFNSSVNLENKQFPFKMTLDIFGMDLAELTRVQNLKYDKLAGKGTLNLKADGEWLKQSTWKGKGNYDIENGYLWQLKIIEGLSNVLLIKEFTHTVYTTSRADFIIEDKKLLTENLHLESQTMKLNAKGWVGFDQQVDFEVYPTLSEIAMIQSESIKKVTSALLAQNISYIKVTGTLKKPVIDPKTSPIDILKNTTGIITEGIGGIVDGIFKP